MCCFMPLLFVNKAIVLFSKCRFVVGIAGVQLFFDNKIVQIHIPWKTKLVE